MNQIVKLKTKFITLGQLLKLINKISSGGEVKAFISTHQITVNKEIEKRRGRKLYDGDIIEIENESYQVNC
ncbi:S4 domain-containing protein YaaA [[Mycoplasma] testudinis]|uniref:S4 domain-containing protein YaaA n=1 Tax=[Mycoplasma] testudinis TaxID=33924 RepID=UPI00048592D6|nr:S4 domain-containing protein YaaA [[Mycoplasma] testudinis]